MLELSLYKYPHEVLSKVSDRVDINGPERQKYIHFIDQLCHFFLNKLTWGSALGLAAPQVGKNYRIFVAMLGEGLEIFVNPEVIWRTKAPMSRCLEGCYSLKDDKFDYKVWRSPSITLKWEDVNGEVHERRYNGKPAQIIQHELDHLDGKCCNEEEDSIRGIHADMVVIDEVSPLLDPVKALKDNES